MNTTSSFDDLAQILAIEPAWAICPKCQQSIQRGAPCWDCERAAEVAAAPDRTADRMGIPARFRWATLDAPELATRCCPVGRAGEPVRALDAARHVLTWGGPAIAFTGPAGGGKTSLAIACIRTLPGALIVPAATLERARAEHRLGAGEARIVERAMAARVLLLDDLGQDRTTQQSAIVDVVNARHDAELPTWYTTGLTVPQIEARYGAGVARRLSERGTAMVVRFAPRAST